MPAPDMAPDEGQSAAGQRRAGMDLERQFVVLPEPYDTRAWLVDLRDPFHPRAQQYETWAAAEAARLQQIQQALESGSAGTA
jgi:hypothetical protein